MTEAERDALLIEAVTSVREILRLLKGEGSAPCPASPTPAEVALFNEIACEVKASEIFRASTLIDAAATDPDLAAALAPLMADKTDPTRALGKLFKRLADRPVGLYVLRRVGDDRESALWTLEPCAGVAGVNSRALPSQVAAGVDSMGSTLEPSE